MHLKVGTIAKSCRMSCHLKFSIPAFFSIPSHELSQLSIFLPVLGDGENEAAG
jgi:hypothetical protein